MATKLSKAHADALKAFGITAKTEEEAQKKLVADLEKHDHAGFDDEDIDTLIAIRESIIDDSDETTSPEEEEETQPEDEALADALVEELEDEEPEEEGDIDISKFDRNALKAFIKDNNIGIKVTKNMTDDDIRIAIFDALEDGEEEDPRVDQETVEQRVTKQTTKKEDKPKTKSEKPKEKKDKPEKPRRLNFKESEEDRSYLEPIKELFPEEEYMYAYTAAGVTVKNKGKNSNRALFSIESAFINVQTKAIVKLNLYFLTFTSRQKMEVLDEMGLSYEQCWNNAPYLKQIGGEEAVRLLEELKDKLIEQVSSIDKRLGDNRKKMEDSLKNDKKVTKKSAVKAKPEPEEESPVPAHLRRKIVAKKKK